MSLSSRVWFGVFVVLVFVTGTFAGVLLDRAWLLGGGPELVRRPMSMRGRGEDPNPAVFPTLRRGGSALMADRLAAQLDLSDDQRARLRGLLSVWSDKAVVLQSDLRRNFEIEQRQLRSEIETLLTDEQKERFRQMPTDLLLAQPRGGRGRFGGR